ncbi:transcriptional regulator, GntR family [Rhizobium sp. RU20A]|uniref:GntR family transcriptional regulator n=1 Tax=Rhizobium sp. RU20A TaxID=1907412 RepID=UPI00095718FF|nr:GntR family transcriptional regulator [Rhizobium sp. RU20A]SIR32849.1 transcriptional regulator, GntR family [Rhizobium sp. RU20A]
MDEKPAQKAQQIYEMLRRSILMLEMAPGSAIVEKEICAATGMSRTPVREAVQKLADEGLVNVIPHSGTYVSRISVRSAEEGFLIRRALEVESVRRAAENDDPASSAELDAIIARMDAIVARKAHTTYIDTDDALHSAIARRSGLNRIWKFISMAKVDLDRMRQLSSPIPGHLESVTEQHRQIVEAVKRGKPDQAELAMRIHLETSFEVMAGLIARREGIFLEETEKVPS